MISYWTYTAKAAFVVYFLLGAGLSGPVFSTDMPVILDNGAAGTRSTGSWKVSSGPDPWGSESLFAKQGGESYTFNLSLPAAGQYQVFAWWTEWSNRRTRVPYDITHAGGTDTVNVNQQQNGGQWNLLGTYNFDTSATVTVHSLGNGTTSADAVMLVPQSMTCVSTDRSVVYRGRLPLIGDAASAPTPFFSIVPGGNGVLGTASITDVTTGDFEYVPDGDKWGYDLFTYQVDGVPGGPLTTQFTVIVQPRIMPLGDSITMGSDWLGTAFIANELRIGYRKALFDSLTSAGYPLDLVGSQDHGWAYNGFDSHHEGHGGWTASELAWGRDGGYPSDGVRAWLDTNPADIVLLHAGTNGLVPGGDIEIEAILDEIDLWESSASGNPVTVVLARIIDQDPLNPDVTAFNQNLTAMANDRISNNSNPAYPDDIVLVDQQSALNYPQDLGDALHPNSTGYTKMAGRWEQALRNLLPSCP